MILTILAENHPHPDKSQLKHKHGFALHVKSGEKTFLYDFGPGEVLIPNSRALDIDLSTVDSAVLSHGHYDHSGGMLEFLKINEKATIYHGRGAFHPRWSISKGAPREIGIPVIPTDDVVKRLSAIDTRADMDDFVLLPAAPGHHGRPAGNASLLAGAEGNRLPDDFTDEITMVLRSKTGLVVVTGCSHRGILNIIDQVKAYCTDCPIKALIGGFHLIDDKEAEDSVTSVGERLADDLSETRIITGHCTGEKSIEALQARLGKRVERLHVGMVISL